MEQAVSNKKLITLTKFKKLEKIKNLQNSKTQNLKLSFMNKIGYLQHSKMVIILFGSQEFFRSQPCDVTGMRSTWKERWERRHVTAECRSVTGAQQGCF